MRTWHFRIVLAVLVFAVAAGAAALLLSQSSDTSAGSAKSRAAVTSDIWAVGHGWTVQVAQDSATISPDSTKSVAMVPYRFTVKSAPDSADGQWLVQVTQDGAEGPFVDGWRLYYVERDGAMELEMVAAGKQKPVEATVASIVLGSNFPYEVKYTATPKDATMTGADLAKRAAQPPTDGAMANAVKPAGSTSKESGATPPANAPVLKPGEIPPGAPGSRY